MYRPRAAVIMRGGPTFHSDVSGWSDRIRFDFSRIDDGLMSVAGGGEVLSFEVYGQFSQYFCVFIDDKTQVGNAVGQKPGVCDAMDQVARSPEAKVWRDRHRA